MIRAARVELFKLRRRPAAWVLGLILVALLLLGYVLIWHFISNPPKGARFPPNFNRRAALVEHVGDARHAAPRTEHHPIPLATRCVLHAQERSHRVTRGDDRG